MYWYMRQMYWCMRHQYIWSDRCIGVTDVLVYWSALAHKGALLRVFVTALLRVFAAGPCCGSLLRVLVAGLCCGSLLRVFVTPPQSRMNNGNRLRRSDTQYEWTKEEWHAVWIMGIDRRDIRGTRGQTKSHHSCRALRALCLWGRRYVYIYIPIYRNSSRYIYIYIYLHANKYICIHISVYIYICTYIYKYMSMCKCMSIYVHICSYIFVNMYIYVYI